MTDEQRLAVIAAWIGWVCFWAFLITKFGYRGKFRLIFLVLMAIPPENKVLVIPGSLTLLFLLIWPWPVHHEKRQLKKQLEAAQKEVQTTQDELKTIKTQVERNVKYIRDANLENQRLQELAVVATGSSGDPEIDKLQEKVNQLKEKRRREKQ